MGDVEEIRQLKSRYAWHFDECELGPLLALFTDDAVCEFGPYGRWEGKEALADGFAGALDRHDNSLDTVHLVENLVIDIGDRKARSRSILVELVLVSSNRPSPLSLVAIYEDDYRYEEDIWKIEKSHIEFLWNSQEGRVGEGGMKSTLEW